MGGVARWGAVWATLLAWCLRPIWGIDIFFHVAIGREVLARGVPESDVFSAAHPDAAYTPFQLGYELLVASIDAAAGLDGLRWLHALVFATGLTLALRFLLRQSGRAAAAAALFGLLLVLFEERLRLRPHGFNLLIEAAVLLPLAAGSWRAQPRRWVGLVFVVALGWSFLHSMGALWLVAVLGTVLVAGRDSSERKWAAVALTAALLGVAVAPGAPAGIAHVLSIQGQWRPFVPELAPFTAWFAEGTPVALLAGLASPLGALAVIAACFTRPDRARWPTLVAAAGLAFGAMWMVRLGYYSVFAVALVWPELRTLACGRVPVLTGWVVALVCAGLLVAQVGPRWSNAPPWTTTLQPGGFPATEAGILKRAGVHGRIFNETEWGGYLLYVLHPHSTVLSDGRITFGRDVGELLEADQRPSQRVAVADEAYRRYGVDLLVRRNGVFPETPNWTLLLRGPDADVWSRNGPVTERRLEALGRVLKAPK